MYFEFERFTALPLRHAMSQRCVGAPSNGDVGYARDTNPDHIAHNRARLFDRAGLNLDRLTLGRQVHGAGVSLVKSSDRGRGLPPVFDAIPDSDGLVTSSPDVVLGVIVADCVPLLLYDPVRHALGVIHAGWRGTVAGIAAVAVERMRDEFGSDPGDLLAGIGPSIGPCCYEVGNEVIDAWEELGVEGWEAATVEREPRAHLDLWQANRLILSQAGVPNDQIEIAGACTRCNPSDYFSHRAATAGERPPGRMIMVAQLS